MFALTDPCQVDLTGSGDQRRHCPDHRLIVTRLVRRQYSDVVEARTRCQSSDLTRSGGSVVPNEMAGVPAVELFDRNEQMHDIATIVPPVPNLVNEAPEFAIAI